MKKPYFYIFIIASISIGLLFLINPHSALAQQDDTVQLNQQERIRETVEEARIVGAPTAEELIEILKKRALLKKEERLKEQFRATKGTLGLHMGYDNNVNSNDTRRATFYSEQYFSYNWTPTFNDYLGAEIGPWYYADMYFGNRDTTIIDTAIKVMLKIFPKGNPSVEVRPAIERQYVYYPEAGDDSSYVDDNASLEVKHKLMNKFMKRWSQEAKYSYSFKEYDKARPRTSDTSARYINSMVLEKMQHAFEYTLGIPMGKSDFKLKQKLTKDTSNDHYFDYYHYRSYKLTGELGRSLTQKLYGKVSLAQERKNYTQRRNTSNRGTQVDKIYTSKLYLYYTLKKDWTLSYTFTHTNAQSNLVTSDYAKATHVAGVYISF